MYSGFDYDFRALAATGRPDELEEAMRVVLTAKFSVLDVLHILLPITRIIVRPIYSFRRRTNLV